VGEVLETQVPNRPDGRFRLKLRIQQDLHALVRKDSMATIKTMGLAGNSFIDIQKGTQRTAETASGGTIPSREPLDIADLMQQGKRLAENNAGQHRRSASQGGPHAPVSKLGCT